MHLWQKLFRCVGQALCVEGLQALVGMTPLGGLLPNLANGVWKNWHETEGIDALNRALAEVATVSTAEALVAADAIGDELVARHPRGVRMRFAAYLVQLSPHIFRSIRVFGIPAGAALRLNKPADLIALLPLSLPQFRPGDSLPGRDPWRLVQPLGTGEFCEVWIAQNGRFDKILMVVKFCRDAATSDLLRHHEAELARLVISPGVVRLMDLNLKANPPWIGFDYFPGGDLTGEIVTWSGLPIKQRIAKTLAFLQQLSQTVGRLHRDHIVHRNIKPSNIYLRDDEALLADLGLGAVAALHSLAAGRAGQTSSIERQMSLRRGAWTPLYASPQQKAGSDPDPRDDIYALGVTAYQMLSAQVRSGKDIEDELRNRGVSGELIALIQNCVHVEPEQRPEDGSDLAARLANVGTELPTRPPIVENDTSVNSIYDSLLFDDVKRFFVPRTPPPARTEKAPSETPRMAVVDNHAAREPKCVRPGLSLDQVGRVQQEWADFLDGPVTEKIDLGGVLLEMNLIPPGTFTMGSPLTEPDRQPNEVPREVTLPHHFYMGVYPVTVAQFRVFATATKFGDASWQNACVTQGDSHPVVNVSWNDATAFCDWLTKAAIEEHLYRLPTEAEWEYACRGGREFSQPFGVGDGNSLSSEQANFNGDYPYGGAAKGRKLRGTTPVGYYHLANGFGLYDMHGNVWEWCEDLYDGGPDRVIRGGSWSNLGRTCRAGFRLRDAPVPRSDYLGFRLVRISAEAK